MTSDVWTEKERQLHARRAMLRDLYESGATVQEIAATLDVTRSAVYQMLKTLDLPAPTTKESSS